MAADRAAELTEAYRILGDEGRRSEYDRALSESGGAAAAAPAGAPASAAGAATQPAPESHAPPPPPPPPHGGHGPAAESRIDGTFTRERGIRDEFVRKATMGRLKQALEAVGGYDQSELRGFDIALVPKKKLFGGSKNPKLLGRFVSTVDRAAVADAWTQAAKWGAADEVCVLLMGTSLAPAGELATEIREQGRKQRGGKLVLIPVDARDWDARMPLDAPPIAKTLLERLKKGA